MHDTTTPPRLEPLKVACSACNLRELCLPVGLSDEELVSLDHMIGARRAVRRGERLCAPDSSRPPWPPRTGASR
jgi:CRP/FNR family transcriptional regulator, anaerobic regulatory protein